MSNITNSILNLIANLMIFSGGFIFYYHYLTQTKIKSKRIYSMMRIFTALLLTGSLARIVFDMNIIYTGINKNFDIVEAIIALSRNIGLGGILIYITNKFKNTECQF
jgi:hypothetical protein